VPLLKFRPATSTLETFLKLLNPHAASADGASAATLGGVLLSILHGDVLELIHIIRFTTEEIRRTMIDMTAYNLEKVSLEWKSLLTRFHYELQNVIDNVPSLLHLVEHSDRKAADDSGKKLQNEIVNEATTAMNLIDRVIDLLRTELDVIESKRNIEQTENVNKLTELAFVFIPLGYCTGLFAVPFREVEGSAPSIGIFVGVSLAFMSTAYVFRLFITSGYYSNIRMRNFEVIRQYAQQPEGAPIRTRMVFLWILSRVARALDRAWRVIYTVRWLVLLVLVFLVLLIPLIFFWRMQKDVGFSVAISLVVVPLDLVIIWVIGSQSLGRYLGLDWRTEWRKFDIETVYSERI
jgi:CorA-like Mg2+ transporter protein